MRASIGINRCVREASGGRYTVRLDSIADCQEDDGGHDSEDECQAEKEEDDATDLDEAGPDCPGAREDGRTDHCEDQECAKQIAHGGFDRMITCVVSCLLQLGWEEEETAKTRRTRSGR
jgi:hypothetical protein